MFLHINLPLEMQTEGNTAIAQCRTEANLGRDFPVLKIPEISVLFPFWNKTSDQSYLFTNKR